LTLLATTAIILPTYLLPCLATPAPESPAPFAAVQFGAGLLIPSWKQWDSRMDLGAHALRMPSQTALGFSAVFADGACLYCLRRLRLGRWLTAAFLRTCLVRAAFLAAGTGSRDHSRNFCLRRLLVSVFFASVFW